MIGFTVAFNGSFYKSNLASDETQTSFSPHKYVHVNSKRIGKVRMSIGLYLLLQDIKQEITDKTQTQIIETNDTPPHRSDIGMSVARESTTDPGAEGEKSEIGSPENTKGDYPGDQNEGRQAFSY